MCSSSPTCVLSGGGLQPQQQEIATISSEISNPTPSFFCEGGEGNSGRCCPMTGILPAITRSHDIAEETISTPAPPPPPATSRRGGRSSGWKTSKFFSRTMSSGEILRGLKKLSLTSSSEESGEGAPRPRKSKSGQQLKKRSSTGNEDGGEEEPKARSPRSPGSFRPLSKAMSVSEPGSSSRSTSSLGIVCRKEDLKAILCTAGKKFPLASPSSMRRRQHRSAASPLRHTKSASFETHEASRKEPVRRAGSEEAASRTRPLLRQPPATIENNEKPKPPAVKDLNAKNAVAKDAESVSTVKWDECEVVDAVVLGDAIESFLKGSMGGSRATSFRRISERRAKSDG